MKCPLCDEHCMGGIVHVTCNAPQCDDYTMYHAECLKDFMSKTDIGRQYPNRVKWMNLSGAFPCVHGIKLNNAWFSDTYTGCGGCISSVSKSMKVVSMQPFLAAKAAAAKAVTPITKPKPSPVPAIAVAAAAECELSDAELAASLAHSVRKPPVVSPRSPPPAPRPSMPAPKPAPRSASASVASASGHSPRRTAANARSPPSKRMMNAKPPRVAVAAAVAATPAAPRKSKQFGERHLVDFFNPAEMQPEAEQELSASPASPASPAPVSPTVTEDMPAYEAPAEWSELANTLTDKLGPSLYTVGKNPYLPETKPVAPPPIPMPQPVFDMFNRREHAQYLRRMARAMMAQAEGMLQEAKFLEMESAFNFVEWAVLRRQPATA